MKVKETACSFCGKEGVVSTEDDPVPKCEECQGVWAEAEVVRAIMSGEMDHIVPGLGVEED